MPAPLESPSGGNSLLDAEVRQVHNHSPLARALGLRPVLMRAPLIILTYRHARCRAQERRPELRINFQWMSSGGRAPERWERGVDGGRDLTVAGLLADPGSRPRVLAVACLARAASALRCMLVVRLW